MRVTQSMLSSNMLRNLNTSYGKMSKYQDMLNSGSIISRPSDDPVVAVKGMGYRVDLDKNEQYTRNIREAHTWLDTTDEALGQVGEAMKRVKELIVQAANDTNTTEDRQKINAEISQIKEQLRDIANTKVGENYIFSGTHTNQPLYTDQTGPQNPLVTEDGGKRPIEINVFDGISMKLNTQGNEFFNDVDEFMKHVETVLQSDATSEEISSALGLEVTSGGGNIPALDGLYENGLTLRAEVGARQNRVDMMENRLDIQNVNVTKQMSQNEDTDYAKTITDMVTQESIHQAALSVGAKIIQQTLVDFIR
ncbi:flagellar hook-associated protein FlgL [Lysinibacillus odysseyi]|uniref:Flagellar hook protein FlgL n=1 Tax=Lysinibacillus odysseyi 34hs-1 = NBRC 100172 TaxID=1220589 RepID=A0A0A3J9W6_9BACI|nr:flagellar hook-associated protein FlgL [Lysinibacillus odysseyi]KGR83792.1 flagellar hook protein FlgL [Lysinibacillus odysseyi 34hs-1 = NBRC 100172]